MSESSQHLNISTSQLVLALETSCDETAVAVLCDDKLLASEVASQIAEHEKFGGVVPEVASRNHLVHAPRLLERALADANIELSQVDAFAATSGPGLASSLMIGASIAKGLAIGFGKPYLAINHLEGHLLSPFFGEPAIRPNLSLVVSGGHTMTVLVRNVGDYRIVGRTVDDAAGEAFDKIAKLLGLGYPGGPEIEKHAANGDPNRFDLPRSMPDSENFSFSGLKTAVRYLLPKLQGDCLADVCASVQAAIVDVLVSKTIDAAKNAKMDLVTISGGVSCNEELRRQMNIACTDHGLELKTAESWLCTDNAAMIAFAASLKLQNGVGSSVTEEIDPNLELSGSLPLGAAIETDTPSETLSHGEFRKTNWLVVFLVLLGLAIALSPIALHMPAPPDVRLGILFTYLPAICGAAFCYFLDRTCTKKEKMEAVFLSAAFGLLTTYLHIWLVDLGQYFPGVPNLDWQMRLHDSVLALSPNVLPHSYRFLPDSLVRLFEQASGEFVSARDAYRNLFGVLIFYSFYRFARIFLRHGGSLFCLALLAVVLPVGYCCYAGQLTDPISYLSFILAFIFICRKQFVYFLLTLVIGCLAKETILAMAGYYLLFRRREESYLGKSAAIVFVSIGIYAITRIWILHNLPSYQQISGVGFNHVAQNWNDYFQWLPGLVFTCGIFIPFALLGWRKSPWTLRSLAAYLFPVLFFSGLIFSWLREARNFIPLAVILVVLAVYHLAPTERLESS